MAASFGIFEGFIIAHAFITDDVQSGFFSDLRLLKTRTGAIGRALMRVHCTVCHYIGVEVMPLRLRPICCYPSMPHLPVSYLHNNLPSFRSVSIDRT